MWCYDVWIKENNVKLICYKLHLWVDECYIKQSFTVVLKNCQTSCMGVMVLLFLLSVIGNVFVHKMRWKRTCWACLSLCPEHQNPRQCLLPCFGAAWIYSVALFCPSGRAIEGSKWGTAALSLALPEFQRVSPERLFCRKLETCVQLQMKCPCCGENLGHCDPILVMHSAEPCTWLCCWVTLLKSLCHSGHLFPAPCPANRTGLLLHYRWETARRFSCTVSSSAGAKGRAQNSSSSVCTAQSSRDLAFGRAGCHCRSDGM